MKFNSKLWMLAVALATVGCSDDIENGPNNGNGNGTDGPTTYMKVAINSEITTRADGGETTGVEEVGEENEYNVKDVTVVLFDNEGTADASDLTKFTASSTIRAVGWATVTAQGTSAMENHSWQATVEVPVSDKSATPITGKELGVIAVTNLGGSEETPNALYSAVDGGTITTGKQLADYLQKVYQTSSTQFVMSTHTLEHAGLESTITLQATVSEDNVPTTNVFVERLAAKIRITPQEDVTNFLYTVGEAASPIAHVALTDVAIVNQLSSGSYLLKRVTENNPEALSSDMTVTYLGDEAWLNKGATANYVLDPWTVDKTPTNVENLPATLTYINRYAKPSTETSGMMPIEDAWDSYSNSGEAAPIKLTNATLNDNNNKSLRLAYTMENTTSAANSLKGYSTGALFKATYYPAKWSAWNSTSSKVEETEVTWDADITASTTGKSFYEYGGDIYANKESVFAKCVNDANENYTYANFTGEGWSNLTVSTFTSYLANVNDPFGYIDYLTKEVEDQEGETKISEIADIKTFEQFITTDGTYGDANYYENGVCYYPYWIRHGDNGDLNDMGIMEFAIVRNNIYDLQITGINGLGLSGTTVPDPEDPDEDNTMRMQVVLYVRNWVVRTNSSILY